jgi:hypothetical protein
MGRKICRVPLGFQIEIGKVWWGYKLPPVMCQSCNGSGHSKTEVTHSYGKDYDCPVCDGNGNVYPTIELPDGKGYQLWETVSEGSPMSPIFDTPEGLARWLADNNASACGDTTLGYDQWLKFISGDGFSVSMVYMDGKIMSGVEAAIA